MNKRLAFLYVALAMALVWVGYSYIKSLEPASSPGTSSVTDGNGQKVKVEDFELPSDMGKQVRLTNYRGQVVALVFYASW